MATNVRPPMDPKAVALVLHVTQGWLHGEYGNVTLPAAIALVKAAQQSPEAAD